MDSFPPSFLVQVPIWGLVLLFLSPINLCLPQMIQNPFWNTVSSFEVLGRFTIIVLVAFAVGVPFSFFEPLFVSDTGLNNLIRRIVFILRRSDERRLLKSKISYRFEKRLRKIGKDTKPGEGINPVYFYLWLSQKKLVNIYNFLVTGNAIFNGLLVGSEIAVIANLLFLLIQSSLAILLPFSFALIAIFNGLLVGSDIAIIANLLFLLFQPFSAIFSFSFVLFFHVILMLLISSLLFLFMLWINRLYWKIHINREGNVFEEMYLEENSLNYDYSKHKDA